MENNKTFWLKIGEKFGEVITAVKAVDEKVDNHIAHDFRDLKKKFDRMSIKVWIGYGIWIALALAIKFL